MATKTINALTAEPSPASGDFIPMWKTAAGTTVKVTRTNLIGAAITGGGTIATGGFTLTIAANSSINGALAGGYTLTLGQNSTLSGAITGSMTGGGSINTGGFTLTVPATGTVDLLGTAQTITATKTSTVTQLYQPVATGTDAIEINMPSSTTGLAVEYMYNLTQRGYVRVGAALNNIVMSSFDNGSAQGSLLWLGRNSNASTPAAGYLILDGKSGTGYRMWVDANGSVRVHTADPTNANDLAGLIVGTRVQMPAGTAVAAWGATYNAGQRVTIDCRATLNNLTMEPFDNTTAQGSLVWIRRNNNASTPAAGYLMLENRAATSYKIWPDASGNLRIGTSDPTNANDGTGTVVGAQTSHAAYKMVTGEPVDGATALQYLRKAATEVKRFVYRDGGFSGQEFSGLVIDGPTIHRYGMDADAEHPAGKSLGVINAIGDLMLAVDYLAKRLEN